MIFRRSHRSVEAPPLIDHSGFEEAPSDPPNPTVEARVGAEPPSLPDGERNPVPRRPLASAGLDTVIATLASFCGLLIQLGYPALYALFVTLALGVGGALTMQILINRAGSAGDDPPSLQ